MLSFVLNWLPTNARGQIEAAASVSVPLIKKALRPKRILEFCIGMFTPRGR
jgi:hypothetical protein